MRTVTFDEKVIILAGGFGTRLQQVVSDVPKPLAPICGKPFLHYLLNSLILQGAREFILSLHFKSDQIIDFLNNFKEITPETISIEWVVEPKPLGTGGAVKHVLKQTGLHGVFFVVNGDTYLPDGFLQFRKMSQNKKYTISLVRVSDAYRYGAVVLGVNNIINNFTEKGDRCNDAYINAGIYKLHSEVFESIPENNFSIEKRVFPFLVANKLLYGFENKSMFIDIGIPEDYRRLCEYIGSQMT